MSERRPGWRTALCGGAALAAATPPAWFAGAEFLVLAGLCAWYVLATAAARPWWHSYLLGCVHMAWFSWSVRHVLLPAYVAIVLVGGLYFVLATAATRAAPRRFAPAAFGIAAAASFWLRAEMPEICYPHGQPCHALWQWPTLLAGVRIGGEPLQNGAMAWLAAATVDLARSWRCGEPRWGSALRSAGLSSGFCLALVVAGNVWRVADPPAGGARVRIAALEPGVHPFDLHAGDTPAAARRNHDRLFEARWRAPTRELLAASPPDLVLWPESSWPDAFAPDELGRGAVSLPLGLELGDARLVVGANVLRLARQTPAGLLVGARGRVLDWHEKQRLVPGGEFLPFVDLLPESLRLWIHRAFRRALGSAPDCAPGVFRPPLRTAAGVPFAVLTCYDNAFPEPAASQVAAGAQFLAVISNEAWYRGGGELAQLAAMTVCRALECGVPIVRCTMDGWSLAVAADGRVLAELAPEPAPSRAARILRVEIAVGPAPEPPVPWLRAAAGPAAALLAGLALLAGFVSWARLSSARTAPQAAPGAGLRSPGEASGS